MSVIYRVLKMKKILFAILSLFFAASAVQADVYVHGYYRKDGTYVQPHYRSNPNSTRNDNWTTRGNVNPYTGKVGTRAPEPSYGGSYGTRPNTFGQPARTLGAENKPFGR